MKKVKDWIQLVVAIFTILGVISTIAFRADAYFTKPSLSYDNDIYYVGDEKSLVHIAVRNEGRASAEYVEVNITVNGQIDNAWVKKGLIDSNIGEDELFDTSTKIDKGNASAEIGIPYIASGMKYIVGFIVKPESQPAKSDVIVSSKNGGIAKRYIDRGGIGLWWLCIGLILGVVSTIAVRYLYLRIRQFLHVRAVSKTNVQPKKKSTKKKEPSEPA